MCIRKFSKRIFQGTTEEISVEGIALYHHRWKVKQTRAKSNFMPMFA
jgi:hypothetical protein